MLKIIKIETDGFSEAPFGSSKEEEKQFVSHIQKPKKKKRELKIMPIIFSSNKV